MVTDANVETHRIVKSLFRILLGVQNDVRQLAVLARCVIQNIFQAVGACEVTRVECLTASSDTLLGDHDTVFAVRVAVLTHLTVKMTFITDVLCTIGAFSDAKTTSHVARVAFDRCALVAQCLIAAVRQSKRVNRAQVAMRAEHSKHKKNLPTR